MKYSFLKAAPLAAAMAFMATSAEAVDFTFCDAGGNPFCDGVSINTNTIGTNRSVTGTHTGCITGTVWGSFVYGLYNLGPTAAMAFGGGSTYADDLTAEVGFASPFPWRLIQQDGANRNEGIMCFGLPAVGASSAASAGG